MSNVVVVDRQSSVRDALAQGGPSLPGAALIVSEDGASALSVIRSTPVDVLVVDSGLSDGLDAVSLVLAVAARHRTATILLRSDHGPVSEVQMGVGWVQHSPSDIAPLLGALREAVSNQGDEGWTVAEMPLVRLLQVVELANWTGALGVREGRRSGVVVSDAGEIVHASFDGSFGRAALERMLRLPGGTLTECDPPAGFTRNVSGDTTELLAQVLVEWAEGSPVDTLEITEQDLVDFMGTGETARQEAAFQLFSDDELAEMALDDAMAIPIPPPKSPSDS